MHHVDRGPLESTALQILRAGPAGFSSAGTTPAGRGDFTCASVAARPDGTALLGAAEMDDGGRGTIVVATRAAGGAFTAPVAVARAGGDVQRLLTTLSARGDALVVWEEEDNRSRIRVRAARRPAGGQFGPPVVVAANRSGLVWLTAGMSAAGDALAVWATLRQAYQLPFHVRVHAAIAPAGGSFGPSRVIGDAPDGRAPVLAVADDGRALLALPAPGGLRVAERAPGGSFGPPAVLARTAASTVAVALGAGGRAAILWTDASHRAALVTRPAPGPFGRPVTLARASPRSSGGAFTVQALAGGGGVSLGLGDEARVAATLTPDGVVAAWLAPRTVAGVATTGVRTAFVPAGGGPVERSTLGGGLRDADNVMAYPLAGGGAGVAWLQADDHLRSRLYAAVPGGTRPADPPAPDVRVGRPRRTLLSYQQPLTLPVTCSAACDVRVQASSNQAEGTLSLSRAGRATLRVGPGATPIARASGSVVRLRLLSGAPGATHPAARTLTVRLRVRPLPPRPRVSALRATRRPGDRIRVTWTIDRPAGHTVFLASGLATRTGVTLTLNAAVDPSRRHRHFALTLSHVRGVRLVKLSTYTPSRPVPRRQVVRVR